MNFREKSFCYSKGFTLLEIVVAVAIFSIIVSITFPALIQFLDMRDRIEEKHAEISALQKTFLFLDNDLKFAVNRKLKDEYGQVIKQSIIINDKNLIELVTLAQDINLHGLGVPRRVVWSFDEGILTRKQYPVADPSDDTFSFSQSLIKNVEDVSIEVNYIDNGKDNSSSRWSEEGRLPDLITFNIKKQGGVDYQRVIPLTVNN